MAPDRGKVQAVKDWPVPSDASEVRQFLGLASYYRRYVLNFHCATAFSMQSCAESAYQPYADEYH